MQESVCMCVTTFFNNGCACWFLLLLDHVETFIYSGTIGNNSVKNGDFYLFLCSDFSHMDKAVTAQSRHTKIDGSVFQSEKRVDVECVV